MKLTGNAGNWTDCWMGWCLQDFVVGNLSWQSGGQQFWILKFCNQESNFFKLNGRLSCQYLSDEKLLFGVFKILVLKTVVETAAVLNLKFAISIVWLGQSDDGKWPEKLTQKSKCDDIKKTLQKCFTNRSKKNGIIANQVFVCF